MSALREAAQQALEALETVFMPFHPAVIALRAALAEDALQRFTDVNQEIEAALAEPVEEPVAYSVGRTLHWHEGKGVNDAKLYLAPPQRKPLPEEEIGIICASLGFAQISPVEVARAIERAHGITP